MAVLGELADWVGTKLNLPEGGWSESFSGWQPTANTGITPQSQAVFGSPGSPTYNTQFIPSSAVKARTNTSSNTNYNSSSGSGSGSGSSGGGQGITESQALALGLDWNNLPGGYSRIGGGSGGSNYDYESMLNQQLDAAYNPAYGRLDYLEGEYRSQQPILEQEVEQQYGKAVPELQSEQTSRLGEVYEQAQQGKKEEKSQIDKARQLYNEMRQSGLTRFGGGSSTGEAYSEILGRETSRQYGDINQKFSDFKLNLERERSRINEFYSGKLRQLDEQKELAKSKLKQEFESKIREINTSRMALDSQKAAKRIEALQAFSQQVQQLNYEAANFQRDIDLWKQYKDEVISTAKSFGATKFTLPSFNNTIGQVSLTLPKQVTYKNAKGITTNSDDENEWDWLTNATFKG